jgi:hypothetical protein
MHSWQKLKEGMDKDDEKENTRTTTGITSGDVIQVEMDELTTQTRQPGIEPSARAPPGSALSRNADAGGDGTERAVSEYKVYKRRWFGLVQLTLLNIIVSWDVSDKWLLSLSSRSAFRVLETTAVIVTN